MQTVDFHVHLLNHDVKFDRIYDKIALSLFGKRFGISYKDVKENPYRAYTKALINNIKTSKYIKKIVLFGVDEKIDDEGNFVSKDATVCALNEEVLKLYQKNKEIIIPFFSVNPNRKDAIDLIKYYHDRGCKGAKFLQNYWGVDTNKKRYEKYFKTLSALNLPLIVHIGNESSISTHKEMETLEMLKQPLECGVTTIAAHMGITYRGFLKAMSKNPKNFGESYFELIKMLKTYPNLYADISALITPVRAKVLPHLSRQKDIFDKLLYATDFPVPFSAIFTSYDIPIKRRIEIEKESNVFDRHALAILEYFDKNCPIYTNWQKIKIIA